MVLACFRKVLAFWVKVWGIKEGFTSWCARFSGLAEC